MYPLCFDEHMGSRQQPLPLVVTLLSFVHLIKLDFSMLNQSLTFLFASSLSLRASRECQNKERLLEQRFRAALRDFQQWLVNAKISTAKCFDVPQSVAEASTSLQRIQVRNIFFSAPIILTMFLKHCWHKTVVMCRPYCFVFLHCTLLTSLENRTFFVQLLLLLILFIAA